MFDGKIMGIVSADTVTKEALGMMMAGVPADEGFVPERDAHAQVAAVAE